MPDIIFENDPPSRTVMRFLLLLQITAMMIVIGLIIFESYSLALAISFLTFIVFITVILWLYFRYQKIPIVKEKRALQQRVLNLQNKIRAEANTIQSAKKKRDGLLRAETDEINTTLKNIQEKHIENGLVNSVIKDATIPGIGPKLKERLAGHGIGSAAHITNKIAEIPGFGESKRQALFDWRNAAIAGLDSTKPISLTNEQLESIMHKYQALHQQNDAAERSAQENSQVLEYDLNSIAPRLQQLAPITFVAYLSKSLASRGLVAAPVAILLIIAQVVSSVSATTSSIISSIPTATATPTVTRTPTATITPSRTAVPSQTFTPTITFTPTMTNTPTMTFTPRPTSTSRPTFTSIPPTLAVIAPTRPAQAVCSCSGDTLNCGDFSSHASAQACYNYCVSIGAGDIHGLDA